jgi:predicted nucleic acid-binding protein
MVRMMTSSDDVIIGVALLALQRRRGERLAAVALHHDALLVSFDTDFQAIAAVSELQLRRLQRPV